MSQILTLRSEAFPEEYGFNSDGLIERMIQSFGSPVSPYANADRLIWITPYHCEAKHDTPSEENIICSLIVVPPVERNDRLMYVEDRRNPELLSSCTLIQCKVDDIEVTELYGLATFAEYQKQGLGKDLLLRLFQKLSTLQKDSLTNTRLLQNKYVWLFYKKNKEHLKTLYEIKNIP
jgi:GNAT superfamily N-acetyltransferase